ncbi:hypothetical protein LRP_1826 [Ligilactobacillus ruminis]|nr:hypothetical protein LRP_1826 [Ligilactobacillus ruminis]
MIKKQKSLEKKFRFLLELDEISNEGGLFSANFFCFLIFYVQKIIFLESNAAQPIHPKFHSNLLTHFDT